jgi:hypothetical protein
MSKSTATLLLLLVLSSIFPTASNAQSVLQKMVDATIDGDTLYIEKNDYVSDNSITLTGRKNLTLIFEDGACITCTSQFQDIFVIQNCSDIQLYNGTFKHTITDDSNNFGSGIYLFQSQNIRIFNANLENNGARGVFALSVNNLEVSKCLISNNSASAFLFQEHHTNIILKGNQYEKNGATGDVIFDFKKSNTDTDPFESIEERALSERETARLDSLYQLQREVFIQLRKPLLDPTLSKSLFDSLNTLPIQPQSLETFITPVWLESMDNSNHSTVWIGLPEIVNRYLCEASGLSRYDTRDADEFFKFDEPNFTNISPKAFLKGIQSDVVYITENMPSNIPWSCDPELEQMVQELRSKGIQQIAEAQETVIYRLLQIWEKYQSANLLLEKMRFQLVGKCRFIRSEYHPETEMLDASIYMGDYYLATMRIPMNAGQVRQLFFNRDDFSVYFNMLVHTGFKQINFHTDVRNGRSWTLPNPVLLAEPIIECRNQLGNTFRFTPYGLLGQLWPDGFTRMNWDKAGPTPSNTSNQYLVLGGMNPLNSSGGANEKIIPTKNSTLYKSVDAVNRIIRAMEFYSKSMNDCYFGLSNQANKWMESIFPLEQKDKQYLVFLMESDSEAALVKKSLLAKGMHLTGNFVKGQRVFCFTKQLK